MKFIAVIPARAGSKSIKNKNLHQLNEKPLIQYTFEQLNKSVLKEKYLLSDDLNIKKLAKKFGIRVDYDRPKNLSRSDTSLADTINHFHKWLISKKIYYDYLVILQPTSPLRSYKDINSAIQIIKITVKYKINKEIICSEIGTPFGIRIIITIGDVKGIIEKMTETTPSGFSAVNIPTYNAIITMKVIGNINCCASV